MNPLEKDANSRMNQSGWNLCVSVCERLKRSHDLLRRRRITRRWWWICVTIRSYRAARILSCVRRITHIAFADRYTPLFLHIADAGGQSVGPLSRASRVILAVKTDTRRQTAYKGMLDDETRCHSFLFCKNRSDGSKACPLLQPFCEIGG